MPPTSLACPCSPDPQPLDHYDGDACPSPPAPLPWLRSLVANRLSDTRHAAGNLTITRLLDCPRKVLIQDFLPYTLYPLNSHSPHVGTVIHAELERFVPKDCGEVEVQGRLFGLQVSGRLDYVSPDRDLIVDYKFHGDRSMDYKRRNPVDDDLVAQMNMQRLLLGGDVKRLEAWHGAMTTAGNQPWLKVEVPLRDEEWIANVRPRRGAFTVGQIAGLYQNTLAEIGGTHNSEREIIKDLCPAVGKTQMPDKNGQCQACKYCPAGVKKICDEIEKRGW